MNSKSYNVPKNMLDTKLIVSEAEKTLPSVLNRDGFGEETRQSFMDCVPGVRLERQAIGGHCKEDKNVADQSRVQKQIESKGRRNGCNQQDDRVYNGAVKALCDEVIPLLKVGHDLDRQQELLVRATENLSLLNRANFKKYKNKKKIRIEEREFNINKRCNKKNQKKNKNQNKYCTIWETIIRNEENSSQPGFEAQMFDSLKPILKVDKEQFEKIYSLGDRMTSIAEKFINKETNWNEEGKRTKVLGQIAESFGEGAGRGLMSEIVDSIGSFVKDLVAKYGDLVLGIISTIVVVRLYLQGVSWMKIGICSLCISACWALLHYDKIAEKVKALFGYFFELACTEETEGSEFKAQGVDQLIASDMTIFVLLATMFPKLMSKKTDIAKFVGDAGKIVTHTEHVVEYVGRIFQRILDFLSEKIGFSNFSLLSTSVPKVDQWISDTRAFLHSFNAGKLVHDTKAFDRVVQLEDRGFELLSIFRKDKSAGSVGAMIRPLSNELCKVRSLLTQEGVGMHKLRQAPVMISFAGGSQIGKSRLMRPFVASLLAMVLSPEELKLVKSDFDAHVYSRQPEHKFWDGYHGQIVCFMDEKDLVKESLLTEENANTDLVRMGNVFAYVLHMAGIEQKGNVYFRSKICMTTSNVDNSMLGAQNAVRFPEAVVNRFHHEVMVRVKKEYAMEEDLTLPQSKWRLDKNKLADNGKFDMNVYDFTLLKRVRDVNVPDTVILEEGDKVSFDELLVLCAKTYKRMEAMATTMIADDMDAFEHGLKIKNELKAQMEDIEYKPLEDRSQIVECFIDALEFGEFTDMGEWYMSLQSTKCVEDKGGVKETFCDILLVPEVLEPVRKELKLESVAAAIKHVGGLVERYAVGVFSKEEALKIGKAIANSKVDLAPCLASFFLFVDMRMKELNIEAHRKMGSIDKALSKAREIVAGLKDTSKNIWERIDGKISSYIGENTRFALFASCVAFVSGFVAKWLLTKLWDFVSSLFLSKRGEQTENENSATQKNVSFMSQGHEVELGDAQMLDPALEDIVAKVWRSNYYSIHFEGDEKHVGYGFFSHGNVFNMCAHYLDTWRSRGYDNVNMEIRNSKGEIYKVPMSCFLKFKVKQVDWCFGDIPHVRRHADIRKLMANVDDLERRKRGNVLMVKPGAMGTTLTTAPYVVETTCVYRGPSGDVYTLPVHMTYAINTKVGDCGLPLFLVDSTMRNNKFIGFHVAGFSGQGACLIFEREKKQVGTSQGGYVPTCMKMIGTVDRPVGSSGVTSIRRSPLYGAWGQALKAPAHLKGFIADDGEIIFPMERAIMRYDKPILRYDPKLVEACSHAAVAANTDSVEFFELPRATSIEIAVKGVPGEEFMESINRSTSPGYPWSVNPRPGFKGKERFFGQGQDITLGGPDWPKLEIEIREAESKLFKGERPTFYFADALKDETIPIEKVKQGKTRLFCPSPIVYQILYRKYFMTFHAKFMRSRIATEHAVGINPYSEEWEMLYRKITKHGKEGIFAGDFSSFDACQSAQILEQIGEDVIKCFGDREYDEVRRLLWKEVWNSKHVVHKTVFEWIQSLPSGHPGTTTINCIFVSTMMRMVWVKVHNDELASLKSFREQVSLVAFGDDNISGVAEVARGRFNQHTVTEKMAELGMVYTSEDKSSNPPPFRSIYDVDFLKRTWRYESRVGRHVAPLRLAVILEMPYWTKKEGYEEIWRQNVDNALMELALHPPDVFAFFSERILKGSREKGNYMPVIIDREILLDMSTKLIKLYGAQMRDLVPSVLLTLNKGETDCIELATSGQKSRIKTTEVETACDLGSWDIYPYLTKMGRVKQYLGQIRCSSEHRVVPELRYGPAANLDNNNMSTVLSENNDMAGTTQILNESGVKIVKRESVVDIPNGLLSATRVGYDQMAMSDFLSKPVRLASATWDAQAPGDYITIKNVPEDAFSFDVYSQKVKGFLGFRGTTILRLQVNGNKFQAGRLLMVFVPQGHVANSFPEMRTRSLKAATQLPRVELDLSTETEVVMEVPYISPTPYYNFYDGTGQIGKVYVIVYSPLATGSGSTTADVTLWAHFKDVELVAPALVAQMADRRPKKGKRNVTEQELEAYGDKPISRGLRALSSAAASFSRVPTLSSIAAPAEWALSALAGAASAFGYSKPSSEVATTKVVLMNNFNMQNHNGVDIFPNLGLDASNKMEIMPGYAGTDVDEMSLNHLVQIPAYFSVFEFNTSHASGTDLANYDVCPATSVSGSVLNSWSCRDHTPLSYFSSFFDLWRGSIVFTFKIVKTTFHSGRLLISYNPANVYPSVNDTSYLLREIVDLRDTSEFRFVVPYTATTQYKKSSTFSDTTGDNIGILRVTVLNELVAPDTVANSVKILVEMSGGPDFELACPKPYNAAPIINSAWAAQMADIIPSRKESERPDRNQDLVGIGSAEIEEQSLVPAQHCIGEKANSVLQLLKRYCVLNAFGLNAARSAPAFRCFTYGAAYSLDPVATPTVPTGDYVSMIGPCFAYSRGSMRMMFVPPSGGDTPGSAQAVYAWPDRSNTSLLIDNSNPGRSWPGISKNIQPYSGPNAVGACVPAYQQLHARLNRPSTSSTPEPVDLYTSAMRVGVTTDPGFVPSTTWFHRAVGDDFALGYFIGVPFVTVSISY